MFAAFDSKEFRRGGDRKPTRLGEPKTDGGFFTQLSAGIVIDDPAAFSRKFVRAFAKVAKENHLELPGAYCSSYAIRRYFGGDVDRAWAFCEDLISEIESLVSSLRLNYVYLAPAEVGSIVQGGRKGPKEEMSAPHFLRRIGSFMPVVAAWWYSKELSKDAADNVLLDNVELPVIQAWTELLENRNVSVIPGGDECDAAVCAADYFAAVTDKRLAEKRARLGPSELRRVWQSSSIEADPFFFNHKFLYAMKWKDTAPARVGAHWRHPLVYLMVDPLLISEQADGRDDEDSGDIRLKEWVEERGWMGDVFAYAQSIGGGAKSFNPGDRQFVGDGDVIVTVGPKSEERANALQSALEIEVLPLKKIRKRKK